MLSPNTNTFFLADFDSLLILLETVLLAISLSFVFFFFVIDSLLCPDSVIFCLLVADEFWLLDDDILFIASDVISSFVDFWWSFCVLLFSWLSVIVSLSMGIISLWELIGISLLLIFFWSNLKFVSFKEKERSSCFVDCECKQWFNVSYKFSITFCLLSSSPCKWSIVIFWNLMYSFCCKFNWWQIWKLSYLVSFLWSESILLSVKSSLISGFFFDDFFLGVSLWKWIGVPPVRDSVSVFGLR